jgi:hypothetical protein
MSPVKHPVSGAALEFDLERERQALRETIKRNAGSGCGGLLSAKYQFISD